MENNDFENLINAIATDAAAKNHNFAEVVVRVRPNGSGSVQYGRGPENPPIEFEGPNTAAAAFRKYIDARNPF